MPGLGTQGAGDRAFTLTESIIAIVVMGILIGVGITAALKIGTQGKENTKASNASRLSALAAASIEGGATVGNGGSFNIDITSPATAVTSFQNGFTIGITTYRFVPSTATPSSYTFAVPPTVDTVRFGYLSGSSYPP